MFLRAARKTYPWLTSLRAKASCSFEEVCYMILAHLTEVEFPVTLVAFGLGMLFGGIIVHLWIRKRVQ